MAVESARLYRRIDDEGLAELGRDGIAGARIEALNDRLKADGLRLRYWLDAADEELVPSSPLLTR